MRTLWLLAVAACGDAAVPTDSTPPADASADAMVVQPLAISPAVQGFGTIGVGTTSLVYPFAIANTTAAATGPLTVTVSDPADFVTSMDGCSGKSLGAGATCMVYVTFAATSVGARTATLAAGDGTLSASSKLSATATVADNIEVISPMAQDFGSLAISVRSAPTVFTVTNIGATASSLPMVRISGTNRSDFALASNGCTAAIPAGGSCMVSATFAPTALAARTAQLVVTTASNMLSVPLSGTATPGALVVLSPATFDFGTVTSGTASAPSTFTISNTADTASSPFGVVVGGQNATSFVIESTTCTGMLGAGATCSATVHFIAGMAGAKIASLVAGASTSALTATSQ